MFGRLCSTEHILPSLEQAGRKRLYDAAAPPCHELRKLNASLLQLFLKLVDQLCHPITQESPVQPHKEIIEHIEHTFVNMQHLINTMRPAQAAIDLKTLLDNQTASRKRTADNLKDSVKKAWDLIAEAADEVTQPSYQLSSAATSYLQSLEQQPQPHPHQSSHALITEPSDELTQPSFQLSSAPASYVQSQEQLPSQHTSHAHIAQPVSTINSNPPHMFDDMMPAVSTPPIRSAAELMRNINNIVNDPSL
ncbi:Mediator complex subunit Med7 [Gracilaria domingensis]|nr:Mediator complex subunit Med7 [Gracilaria domingensis]